MNDFNFIPDEQHFQNIRQHTVGASDIPILLGLSKYKTPGELYEEKITGISDFEGNEATYWGHKHEVNILCSYIEKDGTSKTADIFEMDYIKHKHVRTKKYIPPTKYFPYTEFFHPDLKWAMAHLDCVDTEKEINIEAKSGRLFASIKRDGFDGYDPNNPKGYPLKVYVQCQWQMLCSGIEFSVVRALIDTNTELSYEIQANKKIQKKLIKVASRFQWHVKNKKRPVPVNKSDIIKMFPDVKEKTAYVLGEKAILALKMKERKKFISKKINRFENEKKDIDDALFLLIGGNKYLFDGDNNKICSQVNYDREYIESSSKIKEKSPELYKELVKKEIIYKGNVRYIS